MKTPQDQLFFASGFAVVRNALANGHILTREQRQYCIHAINQHDKLVALLWDLEWEGGEDWDLDGHAIPCCPSCGGHHTGYSKGRHEPDCALAALLKEDKP